MPRRPTSRPRRARVVAAAVTAASLPLLGACAEVGAPPSTSGDGPASTTSTASTPLPTATGPDPSAVATAVDALLARRDAALAAADAGAFAATVADPTTPEGRRQVASFRAARALRATRVTHDVVPPVDDPTAVDVTLRYRVAGVDRADRTATVRYVVERAGSGWRIVSEAPTGADAAPPWLAMPGLAVRRGEHAVVAGTAGDDALREAVATVDRALPPLRAVWSGTPRSTLVLVPDTGPEADALRGAPGPAVGTVAATTDGPTAADGLATGDRVVLDPDARRRLTATGRDVVLTHELVHVAVRATRPGTAPVWLAEGYADHVGYARAGLPQRTLAAPLLAAVRDGTAPTALPGAGDLDPAVTDIEVGYLASWQAAETVVDVAGESGLRALVRACTGPGGEDAAQQRCDAAMPRVLGLDRAALTRRWQQRLTALAR